MEESGRGERIRTSDPLVPNQVRYRTAPHPEHTGISTINLCNRQVKNIFNFQLFLKSFRLSLSISFSMRCINSVSPNPGATGSKNFT